MYRAENDPYCYPGSSVLKNRLGLKTQQELDAFEAEITAQRASEQLPAGRLSYAHYRAIHRHLFQDVFTWAGQIRTVRIAKEGNAFCYPEYIDREMRKLFANLANDRHLRGLDARTFSVKAARFLAELNAIHPFREGNGRTQLSFLILLAERAGHLLALERLEPDRTLSAMVASFVGDDKPLVSIIRTLIEGAR